jgi:hypothetical protein
MSIIIIMIIFWISEDKKILVLKKSEKENLKFKVGHERICRSKNQGATPINASSQNYDVLIATSWGQGRCRRKYFHSTHGTLCPERIPVHIPIIYFALI